MKAPATALSKHLRRCSLSILVLLAVQSPLALSEPGDPADLQCSDPTPVSGVWDLYECEFPGESIYVPNNVAWAYPATYLVPHTLPQNNSLRLRLHFSGYSAAPYSCTTANFSQDGFIVIKNCPGHYPNVADHAVGNIEPLGWWGQFFGDSGGIRVQVSLDKALDYWGSSIDLMAGVMLKGNSYGGTGAILQSMVMPDPEWRERISVVWADVPNTLFVKQDPIAGDGLDERGMYWRNPAVQLAWGDFDISKADVIAQAAELQHVYYRVNGSPADTSVVFDLDFFTDFCNAKQIACFGTWHDAGHNPVEQGINLPFTQLYSGGEMGVRLDQVLPVFTNSSANHWGPRGHYNLGLEWGPGHTFVDTPDSLQVPLRYQRRTGMGGGIPDQPLSATFDVTLRRVQHFDLSPGTVVAWTIHNRSGFATVTQEGEVTIKGITLPSSASYSVLSVSLNSIPGC